MTSNSRQGFSHRSDRSGQSASLLWGKKDSVMCQTKDKTATVNARESYLRNDGGPTEVLEFPSECQYGKMRSTLLAPVFYIIVDVFNA